MTAKFKKLHEISLEDSDIEEDRSDQAHDSENGFLRPDSSPEEYQVQLILDGDSKHMKWKFWRRWRGSYKPGRRRSSNKCGPFNSKKAVLLSAIAFCLAIFISIIISKLAKEPPEVFQLKQGAVAADAPVCSEMAAGILRKNGSAVDAAITALLCVGVVHAESSGIGGGGFMVVREANGAVHAINFRETAPKDATTDMYHSNSSLSERGGLSVAVPGEIKGLELAHKMFGRLPWRDLFKPVIDMCRNGFNLTEHGANAVSSKWEYLSQNELFRTIYQNQDGSLKKTGDLVIRPILADTLTQIAVNRSDAFYTGPIAESIVQAVHDSYDGGILTMDDLSSYEARLEEPIHVDYNGDSIYSSPSPSGGPLFLFVMNIMDLFLRQPNPPLDLTYHRLVEAFKYGFALRTELGDPSCSNCEEFRKEILEVQNNMTNESYAANIHESISDAHTYNVSHYHPRYASVTDSGTTHVSVIASDGQTVSVTSTVNTYFGSKLITSTGIVLNNEMDDFSSPNITNYFGVRPSEVNFIHPGKRPLSSTCPVIVVRGKNGSSDARPVLAIGAAGGTRIPTSTAQAALRALSLLEPLSDAIEARRVHHQLQPNVAYVESGFPEDIINFLIGRGHVVSTNSGFAVVQGVLVHDNGTVSAHSDSRKQGQAVVVNRT